MDSKTPIVKLIVIWAITAVLMGVVSVCVYTFVAQPHFYEEFMENGREYLSGEKFEQAVEEFEKADKMNKKNTEAKLGLAEAWIGLGNIDDALESLKKAQEIDIEDKSLLKYSIDILKDSDSVAAYDLLNNYLSAIGIENADSDIREMFDSAMEPPEEPLIIPPSGKYIKPFTMRMETDGKLGHAYYYSTDGSVPDSSDDRYRGNINIDKNISLKFVGTNPEGLKTDVFSVDYSIDTTLEPKMRDFIESARDEMDNTEVGEEVGDCIPGAKEDFSAVIDEAEKLLDERIVSYDDGSDMYDKLEEALEEFRDKIIVPTDRDALEEAIEKAQELYDDATEGDDVGDYRTGAKRDLKAEIDSAREVFDDILARQDDIDESESGLEEEIEKFESKRITEEDKIIEEAGARIGPVTVTLLWNTTDDLDLHVTSPRGDTISYRNPRGTSGGTLDVDRQVAEFVEHPVENIYWQNPPSGTYTVRVNMYKKRSGSGVRVPFKVRVVVNGAAEIYEMSIVSGTETVCRFTY